MVINGTCLDTEGLTIEENFVIKIIIDLKIIYFYPFKVLSLSPFMLYYYHLLLLLFFTLINP